MLSNKYLYLAIIFLVSLFMIGCSPEGENGDVQEEYPENETIGEGTTRDEPREDTNESIEDEQMVDDSDSDEDILIEDDDELELEEIV